MKSISVLIVEDDMATCSSFIRYAQDMPEINIVDIQSNSKAALESIVTNQPDVVILDLELHLGGGTGLDILKELRNIPYMHRPFILIATNNSSSVVHSYARKLGADFILTKYQTGYTEKSALSFILDIASTIKLSSDNQSHCTLEPNLTSNKCLKQRITNELHSIGISPKAIGFRYLVDAIMIITDSYDNNFYTIIAKKYKKTENSVERAMQNAINKAWKISNTDDLLRHYTALISSEKGVPTIMEFVHFYANNLRK